MRGVSCVSVVVAPHRAPHCLCLLIADRTDGHSATCHNRQTAAVGANNFPFHNFLLVVVLALPLTLGHQATCRAFTDTAVLLLFSRNMSSSSSESELGTSAAAVCSLLTGFFPPTNNHNVEIDRWRKVRVFLAAMTAEPVFNLFSGCDLIGVEVMARALIAGVPSREWLPLTNSVKRVVFIWQFLLLVRTKMDQSRLLSRAVGELLFFGLGTDAEALKIWSEKAPADAKAYRDQWRVTSAEQYKVWLRSIGVEDAVSHLTSGVNSVERVKEQANEVRTGQVWPGREVLRAYLEDKTAEKDRKRAARKRATRGSKRAKVKKRKAWESDDCRHDYPVSVLRAPGVMTFMCGCGYILGFELLRETESPAHVVAALAQRFHKLPRVVYFDTACQAQRNAVRRIPWLLHEALTAWFIDRFHRCNHHCSPVFNADQYPILTRGHDTSGAERQHSIKKKSKSSLNYMSQRRFIVRSRYIAAHNNIRLSQRRRAVLDAAAGKRVNGRVVSEEVQHKPVESFFHESMVAHCEVVNCTCREGQPDGDGADPSGLQRKV